MVSCWEEEVGFPDYHFKKNLDVTSFLVMTVKVRFLKGDYRKSELELYRKSYTKSEQKVYYRKSEQKFAQCTIVDFLRP